MFGVYATGRPLPTRRNASVSECDLVSAKALNVGWRSVSSCWDLLGSRVPVTVYASVCGVEQAGNDVKVRLENLDG